MKNISIAIDGPASSGKSTVAKIIAKKHGFIYIDTGAMYRAITFAAMTKQVDLSDEHSLSDLAAHLPITFEADKNGQLVFLEGKEVTEAIRQNEVSHNVSQVAAHGKVREVLVEKQRQMSKIGSVVMDGRDIGTVVLPDAQVKFFLVASVTERAERRYKENLEKGIPSDFEELKSEIERRDYLDSTRKVSPLVKAQDALLVDTTGLSIEQVVKKIEEIIAEKQEIS